MGCEQWTNKLDAYVDGELDPAESRVVGEHMRTCQPCASDALERVQMKRAVQIAGKRYTASAEFEIFEGVELHVLAHLVELLNQFGVAGDAEVFAFVEQELLVDQIAENVFLALGVDGVGIFGVLLFDFVPKLVFTAVVLGLRNDLIVDAGDNLFHYLTVGCWARRSRGWYGS
jgi:hypothetical protein